jgi:MFS family permease|tara:strand:- start:24137 stop:25300 length:1164 start_codon:yes stop_codon:yes gene_type:complete
VRAPVFQHLKFYFSNRSSLIIGILFSFNSFAFGNWVARIADIKSSIGLSDAALGLGLLGAPLGSILVMPFTGLIIARMGLGRALYIFSLLSLLSPLILSLVNSFAVLVICLAYYGMTGALMGVSLNAAAKAVEIQTDTQIMATSHGMWSFGAMIGAATGSILVGLHVPLVIHLCAVSSVVFFPVLFNARRISQYKEADNGQNKAFALPNFTLLVLSLAAFCIFLNEGAIADWSAVYLREVLHSDPFLVGMAYAGYSMFMAVGRFTGDTLIPKIGKKNIVVIGGLLSAVSLSVVLILHDPIIAIIGFSFVGLGFSCVVPILYSAAANELGYTSGSAISAVSSVSFIGFFTGPPAIGLISEYYGLSIALILVVLLSIMVSLIGTMIKFK